jgi:hypothetical protein
VSTVAAWCFTGLLVPLAVLQVLVATGRPWGALVWGGQHRVLPRHLRVGSAVSPLLYAGFAALLLSRGGVLPAGGSTAVVVGTWVLVAYLAVGVVVNAISRSRPERFVMTPLTLALVACALVVALEM